MFSAKHILTIHKNYIGISSGQYLTIVALVSLVIIGVLATAATKSTEGYVLLRDALFTFGG